MSIDFGAILDVVGALMVLAGAFFTFVAALGLVRLQTYFPVPTLRRSHNSWG